MRYIIDIDTLIQRRRDAEPFRLLIEQARRSRRLEDANDVAIAYGLGVSDIEFLRTPRYRPKFGITQRQLGMMLRRDPGTINGWSTGREIIPERMRNVLADVLGMEGEQRGEFLRLAAAIVPHGLRHARSQDEDDSG
jgi:hypothetical protein